jgi:transcriptional regulator with XRE-family HTH domain
MQIKYFDNYTTIQEELGRRIKEERLSRNMKRQELADQTGVSVSSIVRLEDGEDVKMSCLIRVLQGLNLAENLNLLVNENHTDYARMFENRQQRKRASTKKSVKTDWKWGDEE